MKRFRIRPSGPLRGEARVPGDKSIGHRALIFASLAEGESRIDGLSGGLDNLATADAFRSMGIDIQLHGNAARVAGRGLFGLSAPKRALDCGNSGTTMRLLAGILAAQRFPSKLVGDASLTKRPMGRVIEPLRARGAQLDGSAGAKKGVLYPPLHIHGLERGARLRALDYETPVASAQVKSAILLSGLYAEGPTRVIEPGPSRDHTERMLTARGVHVERDGLTVTLDPAKGSLRWRGFDLKVPGDPSSAAFAVVAAAMVPGSQVTVRGVCVNETRTGFLDVVERMGVSLEIHEESGGATGERVASVVAAHGAARATSIDDEALIVRLIDEIPVLAALAAVAEGTTRIRGAAELRVKESDRIRVTVDTLRAFGVECEEHPDGMDIVGGRPLRGATVESHHDHRIAMTAALLGMIAEGETVVHDTECVGTSFPSFVSLFRSLGADLVEEHA